MRAGAGVALALLCLTAPASGDGKVFSKAVPVVEIPDQRALIHWEDGRERLVIETSFRGEGTEFAWVVPLPALPEIEAA
ncbi:MAG: DUF2330 domain-containing protein [Planctomycetota bacterium]|nr:DUF2330 domain-containing protein [Planctomycetota bacterium]